MNDGAHDSLKDLAVNRLHSFHNWMLRHHPSFQKHSFCARLSWPTCFYDCHGVTKYPEVFPANLWGLGTPFFKMSRQTA